MKTKTKRWIKFSAIGLALQLVLFAYVFSRDVGAPMWVEYMYLSIAGVFASAFGEWWWIGVQIGLVVLTLFYSFCCGGILMLLSRNRAPHRKPGWFRRVRASARGEAGPSSEHE